MTNWAWDEKKNRRSPVVTLVGDKNMSEKVLEVPVLVEIPAIVTPADIKKVMRRRLIHAFLLVALSGVYLSGIFYLYHKQSIVLRLLDPVIEKIAERAAG